ncbi:component of the polarisome [Rhizophlyctis rosea]|uniref:Component of the polarisome n=1 Tax=Rhizophlyctis rosea TaxID=64517 RepID=A0AAD5SKJ8_9FUNG|nr:component of the polarisome [Rhizophlyctis rosea]
MSGNRTDSFHVHYALLRDFLAQYLQQQIGTMGRTSAKEKLARLSQQQLTELSQDVHDETRRRLQDPPEVPFLTVRTDFTPKRNQARQKLATLQIGRFMELASEVFFELERRYPQLVEEFDAKYGPLITREQVEQQERITRERSDSIRQRAMARSQSRDRRSPPEENIIPFERLQSHYAAPLRESRPLPSPPNDQQRGRAQDRLGSLGSLDKPMTLPRKPVTKAEGSGQHQRSGSVPRLDAFDSPPSVPMLEVERMKGDYEYRIAKLEKETNFYIDKITKLESEVEAQREEIEEWKTKYEKAKASSDSVQNDYDRQREVADAIRSEASNLLDEVKTLSQRNETLEAELKKYKALSLSSSARGGSFREKADSATTDLSGAEDEHLISYRAAIDNLTSAARGDVPTAVLVAMKSIVIVCKGVTEDVEYLKKTSKLLTTDDRERLRDSTESLSVALQDLMSVAKNHAANFNELDVGIVDGAVGTLTGRITDLVELLKAYNRGGLGLSPPPSPRGRRKTNGTMEVVDLKIFIEEQTDVIVSAIQQLLQSMRQQTESGTHYKKTIDSISNTVDEIVLRSRQTLGPGGAAGVVEDTRKQGAVILEVLEGARSKLDELAAGIVETPGSKVLKQRIANSSYEVAKHVKELLSLLE